MQNWHRASAPPPWQGTGAQPNESTLQSALASPRAAVASATPRGFWDEQISSRSYGDAYKDTRGRERVTRDFYEVKTEVRDLVRREGAALRTGEEAADVADRAHADEERRRVRELFHVLDSDGSNSLERGEVEELSRHLGKKLNGQALDEAMAEMDKDGSGSVEFDEFLAW